MIILIVVSCRVLICGYRYLQATVTEHLLGSTEGLLFELSQLRDSFDKAKERLLSLSRETANRDVQQTYLAERESFSEA